MEDLKALYDKWLATLWADKKRRLLLDGAGAEEAGQEAWRVVYAIDKAVKEGTLEYCGPCALPHGRSSPKR